MYKMSFWYIPVFHTSSKYSKLTWDIRTCIKQKFYARQSDHKFFSQVLPESKKLHYDKFIPFAEMMDIRKMQAKNSILVQVQSAQSYKELYAHCATIGSVNQMLHYSFGVNPKHFIIVEFSKESDVQNVLSSSTFMNDINVVPAQSTFLWFKASNKKLGKISSKMAKLNVENGTQVLKNSDIKSALQSSKSISEQMVTLHEMTKLNDIGTRLRFLVAKQLESALTGIFPSAKTYPFGSSVNGYGKMGCDLDLVLKLNETVGMDDSRFVFHCKASGSDRSTTQRHMETIGDVLELFLPGCSQVRKILRARVPIIKYHHTYADVECDLSMINTSGVYMSELLYLLGEIDDRVRPLVFTIRKWASEVGLTSVYPGRWITNFSLTLLVIAFLQKPLNSPPVLPPLNLLVKLAGPNDNYITEEGVNCTFLRDLNKLTFRKTNTDSLSSLLYQFFEHYSQFDFTTKAISLNEGVPIIKPDVSPLYIVNPLERCLNVSKNVSIEELEKIKTEIRNAAWLLESEDKMLSEWGLLLLFHGAKKSNFTVPPQQEKLVQISTLFEDEDSADEDYKSSKKSKGSTKKKESQEKVKQNVEKKSIQKSKT